MSIIDTLITDRTQADVTKLKSLLSKPKAMWTNEEWSEFLLAKDKGAYNAADLNRVQEAMEYLAERFRGYGYNVPEIKRPSITEVIPGTSKLPEGYTELVYIQSTGTQYINTLFKAKWNTRVVLDISDLNTVVTMIMGAKNEDSKTASDQFALYRQDSTTIRSDYFGTNSAVSISDTTQRTTIDKNANVVSMYGATLTNTAVTSGEGQYNLYLFALNTADDSSKVYPSAFKLYSCQIYDNGTLIRDYVPCLNPSKEVGLYDIVNGVFYGNAGTGYFLPGPAVSLPEGYTRLEYIESTGTQYIDSGVCPTNNTRVICELSDYSRTEVNTAAFGTRTSASSSDRYCLLCAASATSYRTDFYNNNADVSTSYSISDRGVIDKNKNVTLINGTAVATNTSGSFTSKYNMTLFALNTGGSVAQKASFKMYLFVVYENDVLSRLYTPVLNANGEVGLYDSITGAFYGNSGTGTFAAGDELGNSGGGNIPTQIIERDCWKIGDIPRQEQMDQYLSNLRNIRGLNDVMKSTPAAPDDMELLTHDEANDIEQILTDVDYLLSVMVLGWFYTAEVFCGEV